jgi:hypothetical protein
MAIKKSELYSPIWKSCDELRGGMDANNTRSQNLGAGLVLGLDLFESQRTHRQTFPTQHSHLKQGVLFTNRVSRSWQIHEGRREPSLLPM